MADDDAAISYDGAGEGEDSQSDPIDEGSETRNGPYVSEDDDDEGSGEEELEDDGGQDGDADPAPQTAAPVKKPAEPTELEQRLQEKESQAHSLTVALRQERERSRILEQRFYQVIDRAMQHVAGRGESDGASSDEGKPDPDDPVSAIRSDLAGISKRLEQQDQVRAEEGVQRQVQEALDWVRKDAASVVSEEPSYPEAAAFVEQNTRRNIQAQIQLGNPGIDPLELEERTNQAFLSYITNAQVMCIRSGQSYARIVLNVARDLGWQGGGERRADNGNPRAARSSQLEAERAARAGEQSLGRIPSATPRQQPKPSDLLNMDDDEFDAHLDSIEKSNPNAFKQLAAQLASGTRR